MSTILGIDPGMRKSGYAFVCENGTVLKRGIESVEKLHATLSAVLARHPADVMAIGAGTNAARITALLATLGLPVYLIDERETTLLARKLYYAENPPRGLQRLLPLGLRFPPRPIDDFAAEIIAQRWLAGHGGKTGQPS